MVAGQQQQKREQQASKQRQQQQQWEAGRGPGGVEGAAALSAAAGGGSSGPSPPSNFLPSSFSLDLHSFNHWSAQLALLEALKKLLPLLDRSQEDSLPLPLPAAAAAVPSPWEEESEDEGSLPPPPLFFPDLLVITGRGNRSKDRGAPPVRRAALSLLHALGCPAALARGNDGCVVVRGSALAALFARERAKGKSFGVEEHAGDLVGLDFSSMEISLANRL